MNPRSYKAKAAARAATVIAALTVAVLGFGTAVHASPVYNFQLNTPRVDFHSAFLLPGQPPGDAILDWQMVGSTVDPYLLGYMSVVNAQGFCARIRMQALDSSGKVIDTYNFPMQCPNNANLVRQFVADAPFAASASIDSVKVSAMLKLNGQSWVEQANVTPIAP